MNKTLFRLPLGELPDGKTATLNVSLSTVYKKNISLLKSQSWQPAGMLSLKEKSTLLACRLESKWHLVCTVTTLEMNKPANAIPMALFKKEINTFSGKVRPSWFTMYPEATACCDVSHLYHRCRLKNRHNKKPQIYKSHGLHNQSKKSRNLC